MRPRGIPASMQRRTVTYAYDKLQPSRRAELDAALRYEARAEEEEGHNAEFEACAYGTPGIRL